MLLLYMDLTFVYQLLLSLISLAELLDADLLQALVAYLPHKDECIR